MRIRFVLLFLAVVILQTFCGICWATPEHVQELRDRETEKAQELLDARGILESKPQAEWTDADIQLYLSSAIWTVYYALTAYVNEKSGMPSDPTNLVSEGYLAAWPGNPFDSWAPMKVVGVHEAFTAGALCLEVCPPEFYSRIKNPRPMSFQLSVYGPSVEFERYGNPEAIEYNSWATIPDGALYMLGMATASAKDMEKKWVEMQAAAAKAATATAATVQPADDDPAGWG